MESYKQIRIYEFQEIPNKLKRLTIRGTHLTKLIRRNGQMHRDQTMVDSGPDPEWATEHLTD